MEARGEPRALEPGLEERVLARLGFEEPPAPDLEGLRRVYRAWCMGVPFDNVRKMIALGGARGGALPGGRAEGFFEKWLAEGTGGTCWPTSNALYTLLHSLGFEARRVAGSMHDTGALNHGSVRVAAAGHEWLADSSILCNAVLPLGEEVWALDDPVLPVEVEADGEGHVVWFHTPPHSGYIPCRIGRERTSLEYYLERYEQTRERSPFNQRLYARRNRPGGMVVLVGHTRFVKTAEGVSSEELLPEELLEALQEDIGLRGQVIDEWAGSGGLAASYEEPAEAEPHAAAGKPPSQRGAGRGPIPSRRRSRAGRG